MKYLVFSDLHGSASGLGHLKNAIAMEKPDILLCLGDILHGAMDTNTSSCVSFFLDLDIPILGVRGNCDMFGEEMALHMDLPDRRTLYFNNHRMLLCHAPFYDDFKPGDIVMNGHTHIKTLYKSGGVYYLNPGSIGRPRDGKVSYATITEEGISVKSAETSELLIFLSF